VKTSGSSAIRDRHNLSGRRFLRRPLIAGQGGGVVDRQRAHPPGPWHDPKIACGHQKWKPEAKKIIPSTRPRDRMRPRTCGTRFDGRRVFGLATEGGRGAFPPEPWWLVAHDRRKLCITYFYSFSGLRGSVPTGLGLPTIGRKS